jgi:predicted DNA-binding protein (MmcQ/YjbR family)
MDIEGIRNICNALPHVTEDIKWGNDLCFMIAEKMFCVASLTTPLKGSFKVTDEEFDELSNKPGIIPAPYVARYKWVLVEQMNVLSKKQWEHYLTQSYNLVKVKLPKKVLKELNG